MGSMKAWGLAIILPLSVLAILLVSSLVINTPSVKAFPEYAARTGESCGTCHYSAAGGGPRTQRGDLWVIEDKPDVVPDLPGSRSIQPSASVNGAAAPELEALDVSDIDLVAGLELYAFLECNNCHGTHGEGSAESPALNTEVFSAEHILETMRAGPEAMPAIRARILPDEELAPLVAYVQSLPLSVSVKVLVLDAPGPIFTAAQSESSDGGES